MPERAYADIMGNFRRGHARQRVGAGDYEGAIRANPDDAETYAALAARQQQSQDRELQRNAAQTYAQALAGGDYEAAQTVAGKMGDVEGVTGARAAQQEVSEQQRLELYRGASQGLAEMEQIAANNGEGYDAFIARGRQALQNNPDMDPELRRLIQSAPPTFNPNYVGAFRTYARRLRDSLLTPQQLAQMEMQRENQQNEGWAIDANGRTYRNRGGIIERRDEQGNIIQDTAPVPVPADRVDARRGEDDGIDRRGERDLRREFDARQGDFRNVRNSYATINSIVSAPPTAAGDISLIFAYMKMLDPTSVVREGEQANAQNAAGVPAQVANLYNQMLTGQRLNPSQRQDFANQARGLYQTRERQFTRDAEEYRRLARDYGFDPDRVVIGDQTYDDGSGGGGGDQPPPRPSRVPPDHVWNPDGNNGDGAWEPPN